MSDREATPQSDIRERVARLLARLPDRPQFPSQGRTLFVDLERQEVHSAYTPLEVLRAFLEGRGANMFFLYNLLDESREPLDPHVPLIFSSGLLTGLVPSAARGNVTSWSPESRVLLDSNAGDFFPSFLKLHDLQRLVLYGLPAQWTLLLVEEGEIRFLEAQPYLGMNNTELRDRVASEFQGTWGEDLAMASIAVAGENLVKCAAIMAGPKSCWARGAPGAKMGSLKLKAIVIKGAGTKPSCAASKEVIAEGNRQLAAKLLRASVVAKALKKYGTPFLYKPSRLLGALGALNHQLTTWTENLDAEHFDSFRPGMTGCYECPVACRPVNELKDQGKGDRHDAGQGPEAVTLGKFGPDLGIEDPRAVLRLNNICNELGLDTASAGSAIAWACELYQRGLLTGDSTGGLALEWGHAELFERLLHMTSRREGFGDSLAESAAAVDAGKYPSEALKYCMAAKGLMQTDPHDARILKGFALGLAVATRGMDHLRNRPTLEIVARINDDPAFKEVLYGPGVSASPTSYEGKEIAVRRCESLFAVGDSLGLCRFATKLFNSPSLPGYEEFATLIRNCSGLDFSEQELEAIGENVNGLERLINWRLGMRRKHDTLPDRWFEEPATGGPYRGEKLDRRQFESMLERFYRISRLTSEGIPEPDWRRELLEVVTGFAVEVRLPGSIAAAGEKVVIVGGPIADLGELMQALRRRHPELANQIDFSACSVAVNDQVVVENLARTPLRSGDRVEVVLMMAGG